MASIEAAIAALQNEWRELQEPSIPASEPYEPNKALIRQALADLKTSLEQSLSAAGGNLMRFATIALRDLETGEVDGRLSYVYANNSDPGDPANGIYQWDDGGGEWVEASWYFDALSAIVQPLVAAAADSASDAATAKADAEAAAITVAGAVVDIADAKSILGIERFTLGTTGTGSSLNSAVGMYGYVFPDACVVESFEAHFTAAGTGFVLHERPDDAVTGKVRCLSKSAIAWATNTPNSFNGPWDLQAGDMITIQAATGGFLRQNTGAVSAIGVNFATSPAAVGDLTALNASPVKPTILFHARRATALSTVKAATATASSVAEQTLTGAVSVTGRDDVLASAVSQSIAYTFGPKNPVQTDGLLREVKWRTKTVSGWVVALIVHYRNNALIHARPVGVATDANGFAVATRSHFGGVPVRAGDDVQVAAADVDSAVSVYTAAGPDGSFCAKTSFDIGSEAVVDRDYANTVMVKVTVDVGADPTRVTDLEAAQAVQSNAARNTLAKVRFTGVSAPAGWTASGAWVFGATGATAPAVGGWSTTLVLDEHTSLRKRKFGGRVIASGATARFGLISLPPENSGGAGLIVDGDAGYMRLFSVGVHGVEGTWDTQVPLPAALVGGRAYWLTSTKIGMRSICTFTDELTQESCSLVEENYADYRAWHGQAGWVNLAGASTFKSFQMDALNPRRCRVLIIGTSIEEAGYLGGPPSWATMAAQSRLIENDVVVAARAGDELVNFQTRKSFDLLSWEPDYVYLALGPNDMNQATWRTGIGALILAAEALPSSPEVILFTQDPYNGFQAVKNAENADVLAGFDFTGTGRSHRYIDMAAATTVNADRVTWKPDHVTVDLVHPTALGQRTKFAQATLNMPFVL